MPSTKIPVPTSMTNHLLSTNDLSDLDAVLSYLSAAWHRERPDELLQHVLDKFAHSSPFTGAALLLSPLSPLSEEFASDVFTAGNLHLQSKPSLLMPYLHRILSAVQDIAVVSTSVPEIRKHLRTDHVDAPNLIVAAVNDTTRTDGILLLAATQSDVDRRTQTLAGLFRHIIAHVFSVVQVTADHRTLLTATHEMAAGEDMETILHRLLVYAVKLTHTEAASILLQDPRTGKLTFRAAVGPRSELLRQVDVPLSSIAGQAFQKRRPIIVSDTRQFPLHFRAVDATTGFETRSLLAVPIDWQRVTVGVVEVVNKRLGEFTERDIEVLTALASQAAALIEHTRLAAQRQEALEQLRELDKRKTQFMHLTSHELRTPLTIIRGYAEMLSEELNRALSEGELSASSTWPLLVEEILGGVKRMSSIVEEIGRAVTTPRELPETELADVCLQDIVDFVRAEIEEWARTKSIRVDIDPPIDPIIVQGHWQHLKEALLQITNNAIKFTPDFGNVEIKLWADEEYAYVQVADSGPGIPTEEHERIFDSFYQVENALNRQHPGLGLGLTIARQAVEQHQGQIWVDSEVGKGSKFTIVLPKRQRNGS